MSDEVKTADFGSDPLAGLAADASEETVRGYAAALVRNGLPVDEANKHLMARKVAPLAAGSTELAVQSKERLMGDSDFVAKYLKGDPAAVAEIMALEVRIAKGGPAKLTDLEPRASDYHVNVVHRATDNATAAAAEKFQTEYVEFAAALKLPPEHAQALADACLDTAERLSRMSPIEREAFGREQVSALEVAIGTDTDAQIKAAEATLRKTSGRDFDLKKLSSTNGAAAALQLLHLAQHHQTTGRT